MRKFWAIGVLALTVIGAQADERVQVGYAKVDEFSDFGESRWDRERNQQEFTAIVQEAAAKLPIGQRLVVKVLDVNRAGELEWWRAGADRLRVLRNITWPKIELEYQILEGSRVVKEGTARLADIDYLQNNFFTAGQDSNSSWRYERRLLDRWFKETVLGAPTAR